jgi:hypothetical protein
MPHGVAQPDTNAPVRLLAAATNAPPDINAPRVAQFCPVTFPACRVQIEFGLVGARGVHFGVPRLDTWERIQGDEVVVRRVIATAAAGEVDAALLDFFSEVFDQPGQERPANLHNFPPGPLQPPDDYRPVG